MCLIKTLALFGQICWLAERESGAAFEEPSHVYVFMNERHKIQFHPPKFVHRMNSFPFLNNSAFDQIHKHLEFFCSDLTMVSFFESFASNVSRMCMSRRQTRVPPGHVPTSESQ